MDAQRIARVALHPFFITLFLALVSDEIKEHHRKEWWPFVWFVRAYVWTTVVVLARACNRRFRAETAYEQACYTAALLGWAGINLLIPFYKTPSETLGFILDGTLFLVSNVAFFAVVYWVIEWSTTRLYPVIFPLSPQHQQ